MTIIVTGANRGLGLDTVSALAQQVDDPIVLAGRHLDELEECAKKLGAESGHKRLVPMRLDLASLEAVHAFVADLKARCLPPPKVVICNAGISIPSAENRSVDGYELTFAVNHLGHFLLVQLLLPLLTSPTRILFVASGVHDPKQAGGPMLPPRYINATYLAYPEQDPGLLQEPTKAGGQAYANSKLCNVFCAYELARRLERASVSICVNAFDPGFMPGTGLGRYNRGFVRFMWRWVLPLMQRIFRFGRTPQQSGEALAYLAIDPSLAGVTGRYFCGKEEAKSSDESYDEVKAAELWHTSMELVGLSDT